MRSVPNRPMARMTLPPAPLRGGSNNNKSGCPQTSGKTRNPALASEAIKKVLSRLLSAAFRLAELIEFSTISIPASDFEAAANGSEKVPIPQNRSNTFISSLT